MTRARAAVAVCVISLSILPRLAHAGDPLARARALYDEAGQLEAQERWPEAQDRLREAIAIHETANLRYALGWALERGGNVADARREYEVAKAIAERTANEEVLRLSRARLAATARPPSKSDVAERPTTAPSHRSEPSTVLPWTLVIAGGTLITTGLVFVASSASDSDDRDAATARWCAETACRASTATKPESAEAVRARNEATDAASRGNVKQGIGFTAGALGVVAAAVGAYLFVRASSQAESSVRVGASVSPGMVGGTLAARF